MIRSDAQKLSSPSSSMDTGLERDKVDGQSEATGVTQVRTLSLNQGDSNGNGKTVRLTGYSKDKN